MILISRLLVLVIGLWLTGRAAARPVVVLDPGHGGRDKGTMWGGVAEKTLTLRIAQKVEAHLKQRGIRTALTRRSDVTRSLESRAALANAFRESVFVSIHCNADPQHAARGIETFYAGSSGRRLAASIHTRLDARTVTPDRGLKFADYSVLRKTNGAAALVECGFLTSPSERRLLTTPEYQERLARAIADGITAALR